MQDWQPAADQQALKARARLLSATRAFFDARGYLEVDTPSLASTTVTDPHVESITAHSGWLQTSPEYCMKRLLANGSGPIYQIAHAFRQDEVGRWHNPEFSLLEWYVPGFDHRDLMTEVEALLNSLFPEEGWRDFPRISYQQAFTEHCGLDPFTVSTEELRTYVSEKGIRLASGLAEALDKDAWLDLIMGELIGPALGTETPCFVVDYPPSQAALARIRDESPAVASRFELYWRGLELANGFHELGDAKEQRQRFQNDLHTRGQNNQPQPPLDEHFLAALEQGLPDCAGVALGIDRLLALSLGHDSLAKVLAFPRDRV